VFVPILVVCLALVAALVVAALRLDRGADAHRAEIEQRFLALGEELGARTDSLGLSANVEGRSFLLGLRHARAGTVGLEIETDIGDDEGRDRAPASTRHLPIIVRRETWIDRLGKRLFINREVQTGDDDFDAAVYVESDAPDAAVERVLSDPDLRRLSLALLERGFARVMIHEGTGKVVCTGVTSEEGLRAEEVRAVCRDLAGAARAVPPPPRGAGAPAPWLAGPLTAVISAVAAFVGFALASWARGQFYPLSRGATVFGLGLGLLAWVCVLPLVGALVRGRSGSFRLFGACFCLLLVALPLAGVGLTVGLNGRLDAADPLLYHARVQSKWSITYKGSTSYYVRIEGLSGSSAPLELPVEHDVYTAVHEGEGVVVEVGPGRFGWEWLKGIRRGS